MQIVFREVEGLPKGSVKAVIDAYGELVDEGCLAIFGPRITDNCVPVKEAIEERFRVPAISVTGTDDWLGEWTFSLSDGIDDRRARSSGRDLLAKAGHTEVGVLVEQSLVGESYIKNFRNACRGQGHSHRRRGAHRADCPRHRRGGPQPARSQGASDRALRFRLRDRLINPVLQELNWDPPRFTGTAFQNAWINPVMWNAFLGWIGIDQYDECNVVGQRFLDRTRPAYGRRPQYCVPVVNRDIADTSAARLRRCPSLEPTRRQGGPGAGARCCPPRPDAPGTRISFGKWTRGLDGRRLSGGSQAGS